MRVLIISLVLFSAYLGFQLYGPSLDLRTSQTVVPVVPVQQPVVTVQPDVTFEVNPAIYKCLIAGRTVYSSVQCTNATVVAAHMTVIPPVAIALSSQTVALQDIAVPSPATNEPAKRTDCKPEEAAVEQVHIDLRMCTPMQCEYLHQRLRDANAALDACQFSLR